VPVDCQIRAVLAGHAVDRTRLQKNDEVSAVTVLERSRAPEDVESHKDLGRVDNQSKNRLPLT
jgi:hypothetical protein